VTDDGTDRGARFDAAERDPRFAAAMARAPRGRLPWADLAPGAGFLVLWLAVGGWMLHGSAGDATFLLFGLALFGAGAAFVGWQLWQQLARSRERGAVERFLAVVLLTLSSRVTLSLRNGTTREATVEPGVAGALRPGVIGVAYVRDGALVEFVALS
jgi:hypothetical protein